MKAYKCDECKEFFEGLSYGYMELKRGVTREGVSGFVVLRYDLCKRCYEEIKKARE